MWSLLVEDGPVGFDVFGELGAVVDLVSVQVLVFQGSEAAFTDTVGVWALVAGPDVLELGTAADIASEDS